ncbi:MAG TPA: DUF5916 domain-containing protein [Gemmatimonadales bacterium]|nr:DUF5916 domain-containing protein [Gemmatimonadales bacterium]
MHLPGSCPARVLAAFCLLLLSAGRVAAQSGAAAETAAGTAAASPGARSHAAAPQLHAAPAAGEVHLDGRLDAAAWAAAVPAALATQRDPDEGRPPTERTEVRMLVGDGALWIGARMYDREPARLVRRLARRDDQPAGDRLVIRLDARHDHLTAFLFAVYPAGNKDDAAVGADGNEDYSWDPVWDVATQVDSLGWTAEVRIPLSQLRFNPAADAWGLQLQRFLPRRQEEDVFAFTPKNDNEGVNRYGHLTGMQGLPRVRRLEVTPYASARAEYAPADVGDPFHSGHDYFGSAGGDLRWGVTSDLTLDATVNPDFGQVEIDPAVVNLSAFETFLPEKRPFFVEGADLFNFGQVRTFNNFGTPVTFFSRRIGRPPQLDLGVYGGAFSDAPAQTTITAAAKLTGKTRGGWSIAALDAVTPEETGRFVPDGTDPAGGADAVRRAPVEPLTNYFVGRVSRELRQGNTTVGALVTAVNRDLADTALAARLRASAYLGGLDFNHSWGDRNWAFDGFVAVTRLAGSPEAIARAQRSSARYFDRPDATHLAYDPTRTTLGGYASQVAVTKLGGGHWGGNLALSAKSPGYETNDVGFAQSVGRRGIATDIHYQENRPNRLFRNFILGFLTGNDWNYDGNKTTTYVGNVFNFRLRNFWSVNSSWFYNFAAYDDQLTRGGPLARLPDRRELNFSLSSPDRGGLTVGLNGFVNWNGAGGWGNNLGVRATVQPAPNVRLSVEPSFTRFHNVSQYVDAVDDPLATATFGRRTVFATLDQRELALDTRLDWTFTPKLSLQLYVQPLVSQGRYADFKEFRAPRTFAFDVYGRDRGTIAHDAEARTYAIDPDGAGPAAPFTIDDPTFDLRSLRANVVFRWEYRPGSTLFLVWQQSRTDDPGLADFRLGRDLGGIFAGAAHNVLAVKLTYWLGL